MWSRLSPEEVLEHKREKKRNAVKGRIQSLIETEQARLTDL
jgi:hypothetical protein